ncbi:MAG TPA: ATP-grasp domain-containing protein, partial [Methylomirabilota bacterium]|nr:ATP-grasp domain-containing protein [Methylomirabilota bacterium]
MSRPAVLVVTHCHTRIGFAVARSLTAAGYSVVAAGRRVPSMCRGLPGVCGDVAYPEPFTEPEAFVASLVAAGPAAAPRALLPVHEEIFVVSRYRSALEAAGITVLAPPLETLLRLQDKGELPVLAARADVPVPPTRVVSTAGELRAAVAEVGLPLVLKPRCGSGARGVRLVRTPSEADAAARAAAAGGRSLVAQAWVPGRGAGMGGLFVGGRACAVSGHLRVREIPISGGASTARVTLRHDGMRAAAERLMALVPLDGVAMAEFRYEPATGRFWLLEVNPRYWGAVATAIESGVDVPRLHVRALLEHAPPPACAEPERVIESRWLLGEIRAVLELAGHGRWREAMRACRPS